MVVGHWTLAIGDWPLDIELISEENLKIGGVLTSPSHSTLEITGGYHSTLVPVEIVERLLVGDLLILPVFLALLVSVILEISLSYCPRVLKVYFFVHFLETEFST